MLAIYKKTDILKTRVGRSLSRTFLDGRSLLGNMSHASKFSDVPLVSVDLAILLCWEEQVNQGKDCSLFLECKNGKISTILNVSQLRSSDAKASKLTPASESQAGIKKKKNSSKRLQKLLACHQCLVTEKGLPPTRLMLQHAAAPVTESAKKPEQEESTPEFSENSLDNSLVVSPLVQKPVQRLFQL